MQASPVNPLEYLLLVLLGGGFGPTGIPPAQEDPVIARSAPAECLLFVSWSATTAPDPTSSNRTERLLAEPEVRKFIEHSKDLFVSAVEDVDGHDEAKQAVKEIQAVTGMLQD